MAYAGGEIINTFGIDMARSHYDLGHEALREQLPNNNGQKTSAVVTFGDFSNPVTDFFCKNVRIAAVIELDDLWVEIMPSRTIEKGTSIEIPDCPCHGGKLRVLADSAIAAECTFTSEPATILAEKAAARAESEEREKTATQTLSDAIQSMSKATIACLVVGVAAYVLFKAESASNILKQVPK